ncbi:hypothetical protein EV426DRAFT_145601 [Tirmania nivea]|nr:hypothetical protein EV426DRAFT_145601 [Tirmania nivea]
MLNYLYILPYTSLLSFLYTHFAFFFCHMHPLPYYPPSRYFLPCSAPYCTFLSGDLCWLVDWFLNLLSSLVGFLLFGPKYIFVCLWLYIWVYMDSE